MGHGLGKTGGERDDWVWEAPTPLASRSERAMREAGAEPHLACCELRDALRQRDKGERGRETWRIGRSRTRRAHGLEWARGTRQSAVK